MGGGERDPKIVEFLLNYVGIDKDKKDIGGRTALSWTIENKSLQQDFTGGYTTRGLCPLPIKSRGFDTI